MADRVSVGYRKHTLPSQEEVKKRHPTKILILSLHSLYPVSVTLKKKKEAVAVFPQKKAKHEEKEGIEKDRGTLVNTSC